MRRTVLVATLLLLGTVSCSFSHLGQVNPATVNFDGYMLALMWPRGQCSVTKCAASVIPSKLSFTVHGLWPASFDPQIVLGPTDCAKASDFSSKKLTTTVQTALQMLWPSMTNPNENFWRHEYEKHGTCWLPESADLSKVPAALKQHISTAITNKSNKLKLQESYFLTTFALTNQLRLEASLVAAGFGPRAQPYNRQDFLSAVKKISKTQKVTIMCEMKSNILSEIRVCFDKNYQPASCAKDIVSNCNGKDLVFPA